ncbi:MMPL family transporter [Actinospica sp.]|uniref:MMPL family transporter n=1 Tax=Actinospica sp. TaxID=1872142 RepID=UPI002C0BDD4B|nr:MMPL family transporter [Actinospica sp.]HWG25074.1 MMPL family transporter [Actinospica sp.]
MATFLYRLGRLAFRRRRLVTLLWLLVLAGVGLGAANAHGTTNDAFTIPGTQSQRAIDLLQSQFPQVSAAGANARVVFEAPAGQTLTSGAHKAEVENLVAELGRAPQVANVADPYRNAAVSGSGTIAFAQVTYTVGQADVTAQDRDALTRIAQQGDAAGLQVSMGGTALQAKAQQSGGELIGLLIAALVLAITFGSLLAAGLPLLNAIFGIVVALCSIQIVGAFVDMSSSTSTLALMLGLAVAIDYALFIVSRYRSEIAAGREPEDAAGRALGTAGSAVLFAGLTVMVALAGLSIIGIGLLTDIGLAAAFSVAVAVLIALTLLPAVLGFAGPRIMRGRFKTRRMRALEQGVADRETMGVRWARFVTRHPAKLLAACVAVLVTLAIPVLSMHLALPDDGTADPGSTERIAYDTLSKGFGPGYNGPLTIVVDARHAADPETAAEQARTILSGIPDVASVSPAVFNTGGDVALLRAIPGSSPSSPQTVALVSDIRAHDAAFAHDSGADLLVTGTTALNIDVSGKLGSALLPYLGVVVTLALLLQMLVFRSLLVPVKAALGFLLSVVATLGVVVAVFQWGWLDSLIGVHQSAPIVSILPIFMIGVVFGLAMDYEVFLVTRMREEFVHGAEPVEAVVAGFRHGARVVTAAAIIMISVFAGFLLNDVALVKSIGLGLAAAVLLDAFIVRMTLVPAVMTLLGRRAWALPRWLDRVLPNVDVEGESLRRALDPVEPAADTVVAQVPEDLDESDAHALEPAPPAAPHAG